MAAVLLLSGCDDAGETVKGSTYEVTVPDGWEDESEQADDIEVAGYSPEVILTGQREDGFTTNVNVIRESSLAEDVDLDKYMEATRELLEQGELPGAEGLPAPATGLTEPEPAELDGERALSHDYAISTGGRELRFRQVVTVREGSGYAVTFTALRDRFEEDVGKLDDVVESWRWR